MAQLSSENSRGKLWVKSRSAFHASLLNLDRCCSWFLVTHLQKCCYKSIDRSSFEWNRCYTIIARRHKFVILCRRDLQWSLKGSQSLFTAYLCRTQCLVCKFWCWSIAASPLRARLPTLYLVTSRGKTLNPLSPPVLSEILASRHLTSLNSSEWTIAGYQSWHSLFGCHRSPNENLLF